MTDYVLKLSETISLSIVVRNQLIFYVELDNLSQLPAYCNGVHIDSLKVLVQGVKSSEVVDGSYRLASYNSGEGIVHFIMPERDLEFLIELCNGFDINSLKLFDYTQYIIEKYNGRERVIAIDNYLDKYIAMFIERGEIKEIYTCSKEDLPRTINRLKQGSNSSVDISSYNIDIPVSSVKDSPNALNIAGMFYNYSKINKYYLFALDHIHFVMTSSAKELISKDNLLEEFRSDVSKSSNNEDEDSALDVVPEAVLLQRQAMSGKKFKGKKPSKINKEKIPLTIADKIVSIIMSGLLILAGVGIYLTIWFDKKVDLFSKDLDLAKSRYESTEYLDSNTAENVRELFNKISGMPLTLIVGDNGKYYVTLYSSTPTEKENNRTSLSSKVKIKDSDDAGTMKLQGKDVSKTKYEIFLSGE